ncbi:MAG: hypothetical protein A2144_12880 [Chloroflexi bacterium RBG_16_50_9]|nr:MAG: hypothetical protein A2144_12880 [Chloroflexi bacterium RBG_16_50_9]
MTNAITPDTIRDRTALIDMILPKYFGARVLSLATSLMINVSYPKLINVPEMMLKEKAKENLPSVTSPSFRAIKIDKKKKVKRVITLAI